MTKPQIPTAEITSRRDPPNGSQHRWYCSLGFGHSLVIGVWILVVSISPAFADSRTIQPNDDLTVAQQRAILGLEIFTNAWFFVLGAVIGSFLNVVVYRLPLGMKLGHPPSRCPACETPIEKRDNLPIIGWLRLKGRCRACGARISPRYPLIEAFFGLLFLVLCRVELLSGGANLPVRTPNSYAGVVWIIWYTKWDLVGLYFWHLLLLSVLWSAALMHFDGHRLPNRLWKPILALGLLLPAVWPTLMPVAIRQPRPQWLDSFRWSTTWQEPWFSGWSQRLGIGLDGFLESAAGLLAGAAIGCLSSAVLRRAAVGWDSVPTLQDGSTMPSQSGRSPNLPDLIPLFAMAGTFLGWQASVLLVGVFAPLLILRARRFVPVSMSLAVAATVLILAWRPLASFSGRWGLPTN